MGMDEQFYKERLTFKRLTIKLFRSSFQKAQHKVGLFDDEVNVLRRFKFEFKVKPNYLYDKEYFVVGNSEEVTRRLKNDIYIMLTHERVQIQAIYVLKLLMPD